MPIYKQNAKKDGLQKYLVRLNYVDRFGVARQLTRVAYGKAEAQKLEADLQAELFKPANPKITVAQLCAEYREAKKADVRANTLRKVDNIVKRDLSGDIGSVRLDKLTVPVLQKWKNELSEKDLAVRTKQNSYRMFSAILNFAVNMGYIADNPLKKVGNFREPYFEAPAEKIQYYTAEEFLRFIAAAKSDVRMLNDWNYVVFFSIAFYTGMRKGEINALRWSDIDGNVIHVRRAVYQKIKGGDIITPPKTKSSYRDLQAPAPLLALLEEHKARQAAMRGFSEEWYVTGGDKCLRDSSIENRNKKFATAAELRHIRIHDFRHSHASLLANAGINIQEIARRLGHSKVEITWNTYSHLYPTEEERSLEILNKVI